MTPPESRADTRTVGLLQYDVAFGDPSRNLTLARELLGEARPDLLVLPEFCASGYSFRDRTEAVEAAEAFGEGPTSQALAELSARTNGIVVGGYPERDGAYVYNAAGVFAAGAPLLSYRKVHLFGFESECFDPGDGGFPVVEHRGLRVGVMICFDWVFPEAARALALQGADVIAHPSNLVLPGLCQRAMGIRALENRLYTVTANRTGTETRTPRPSLTFTGASQIMDPKGEIVCALSASEARYIERMVDLGDARSKTLASGNHVLDERRPEHYGPLFS